MTLQSESEAAKAIRKAQPLDEHLQILSYADRLHFWSKERPYNYKNVKYRIDSSTTIEENDIETDGLGNLIAISAPFAVACFGEIIPYVRFRKFRHGWNKKRGEPYESRCLRCKAKPACRALVKERIKAIPGAPLLLEKTLAAMEVEPAHNAFSSSSPHGFRMAIERHGSFHDANAALVNVLRFERGKEERERDARRKRRDRKRGYLNGVVDEVYVGAAIAERNRRLQVLLEARAHVTASRTISKLPDSSCEFIADVWLCEWLQRYRKPMRDVDVADWLILHGRHQGQKRDSLQGRVASDRRRVAYLEREEGSPPLWGPFDPEAAIAENRTSKSDTLTIDPFGNRRGLSSSLSS